jgi:hypothetical protein
MDIRKLEKDLKRAKSSGNLRQAAELANQLGHLCKKHNKYQGITLLRQSIFRIKLGICTTGAKVYKPLN